MKRFKERKADYHKATLRLKEALQEEETEIVIDGVLHRFEFTFELAWKTMKDYLEKTCIEEAQNAKIEGDIVLDKVLKDFETLLQKAMTIKKLADEHHIYATSSLIDDYILEYSKIIWMLKQHK